MDLGERKRPRGKGGKETVDDRSNLGLGMVMCGVRLGDFGQFGKDSVPV